MLESERLGDGFSECNYVSYVILLNTFVRAIRTHSKLQFTGDLADWFQPSVHVFKCRTLCVWNKYIYLWSIEDTFEKNLIFRRNPAWIIWSLLYVLAWWTCSELMSEDFIKFPKASLLTVHFNYAYIDWSNCCLPHQWGCPSHFFAFALHEWFQKCWKDWNCEAVTDDDTDTREFRPVRLHERLLERF